MEILRAQSQEEIREAAIMFLKKGAIGNHAMAIINL